MEKGELLALAYIKVAKAAELLQQAGEELTTEWPRPTRFLPSLS